MSRDTSKDLEFKKQVRAQFSAALKRAREMGLTVDEFASTLGITRAALHKYTRQHSQSIPSLRVLERARRTWKIQLKYGELGEDFIQKKKASSSQLEFSFSTDDITKDKIQVEGVRKKGPRSVELRLTIDLSKAT